jgi:hypothetical protein
VTDDTTTAKDGEKPLRLGELITLLESLPSECSIRFYEGENVGPFMSWRGAYDMLSLEPNGGGTYWKCGTVGKVLQNARSAVGAPFTGYKGGEFRMTQQTFVWADAYGECPGRAVIGVERRDDEVLLVTKVIDTSSPAIWSYRED